MRSSDRITPGSAIPPTHSSDARREWPAFGPRRSRKHLGGPSGDRVVSTLSTRLTILSLAFVVGCGDGGPTEPGQVENGLVFNRADQSIISFAITATARAWCGAW